MDITSRFQDTFVALVREYAVAAGREYDQYYEPNFANLSKIANSDLVNFFRAIDHGCVVAPGDGYLHVGGSRERIFDHGEKSRVPRYAKVCVEPILAQGAIARLTLDYGWPKDAIRTQWSGGKFDLSVFRLGDLEVQCEIKASAYEVEGLASYLRDMTRGANPTVDSPKKLLNWSRKFDDLAVHKPKMVWILGPGGSERLLKYVPTGDGEVLDYVEIDNLYFDGSDFGL